MRVKRLDALMAKSDKVRDQLLMRCLDPVAKIQ